MNVEDEELARWARFADAVRNDSLRLCRLLAGGKMSDANRLLMEMHLAAARTLSAMELAGAEIPSYLPRASDTSLTLLTSEANRRYCLKLREAWEAAIEVDKERGCYPDGPADLLADRLARVEREVYGPAGLGEGE